MRQSAKRNEANRAALGKMRTLIKKVLGTKEKPEAESLLSDTYSVIDKASKNGLIHHNNAARKKASIAGHINSL